MAHQNMPQLVFPIEQSVIDRQDGTTRIAEQYLDP